jgi:Dienelactone hydrolase and related enzymes
MKLFLLGLMALTLTTVQAGIVTREVSYPAGSVTARGFLALPEDGGKHPGVLVVHEWWGLNDYARKRAEQLAALGYVALAVDMYGDGKVAGHPKDAGSFAAAVMKDLPEARRRFEGALAFLAKQPGVDPDKIAAIRPNSTPWPGRPRWSVSARAKSSSPAWMPTARAGGMTSPSPPP